MGWEGEASESEGAKKGMVGGQMVLLGLSVEGESCPPRANGFELFG